MDALLRLNQEKNVMQVLERIYEGEFYHPEVLSVIGNAFINTNKNEPVLLDAICLTALGNYIISRFKQQPYAIDADIVDLIAQGKRWDTTDKIGATLITSDDRSPDDYRAIIDARLHQLLAHDSLPMAIFNLLIKALAIKPGDYKLPAIKIKAEEDLAGALNDAIDILHDFDQAQKAETIAAEQIKLPERPHYYHSMLICEAINSQCGIRYAHLNKLISSKPGIDLELFNIKRMTKLNNFIIGNLREKNFLNAADIWLAHASSLSKQCINMLDDFCSNDLSLEQAQVQQFITFLEEAIAACASDISLVNFTYEDLDSLLNKLRTDSTNKSSADLIAIIMPTYTIIADALKHLKACHNYMMGDKSSIEAIVHALPFRSSVAFQALHLQFDNMNQQFCTLPDEIRKMIDNRQQTYLHISESIDRLIANHIPDRQEVDKGQSLCLDNFETENALAIMAEINKHIQELDDLSLALNILRAKCASFEDAMHSINNATLSYRADTQTQNIALVFEAAIENCRISCAPRLKLLSDADTDSKIDHLKQRLERMRNSLVALVKQRNKPLKELNISPARDRKLPLKEGAHYLITPRQNSENQLESTPSAQTIFFKTKAIVEDKTPIETHAVAKLIRGGMSSN